MKNRLARSSAVHQCLRVHRRRPQERVLQRRVDQRLGRLVGHLREGVGRDRHGPGERHVAVPARLPVGLDRVLPRLTLVG